jgi:hypothetical protein
LAERIYKSNEITDKMERVQPLMDKTHHTVCIEMLPRAAKDDGDKKNESISIIYENEIE